MNILISSAHYYLSDKFGSEPAWGVEIANQYAHLDHQVYLICGIADLKQTFNSKVHLHSFFHHRSHSVVIESLRRFVYPVLSFVYSLWVYLFVSKKNIDLVHHIAPVSTMSYDLFFIFRPSSFAKFIIGPALPPADKGGSSEFANISGTPNSFFTGLIWKVTQALEPLLHQLFKLTIRKADYLIAATPESAQYYSSFLSNDKIRVIPIGSNISNEKFSKPSRTSQSTVILSVCYLVYRKGLDLLLNAMRKLVYDENLKQVTLRIVGDGEEKEKLISQANNLNISKNVQFMGLISHTQISKQYQDADIFCSPTRYEPYGMTLIEAMASALPVVVSDVNSTAYLIGDGGLLFKKDDVDDLTQKLKTLVINSSIRKKISINAKNRYANTFNWSSIVNNYLNL